MATLMGNRQKGAISASGDNKVKLIFASEESTFNEQVQSESEDTENEKMCKKSNVDSMSSRSENRRGDEHAHTNLGMSTDDQGCFFDIDADKKGEELKISEIHSDENKKCFEGEVSHDKTVQNNSLVLQQTDTCEKEITNLQTGIEKEIKKDEPSDHSVLDIAVKDYNKTQRNEQTDLCNTNSSSLKTDRNKTEENSVITVKDERHTTGEPSECQVLKNGSLKRWTFSELPTDTEDIQQKASELQPVEKLQDLVTKINPKESNLSEPLAMISKIIREQTGETVQSELITAMLIRCGFIQKFEDYLTVNNIHAIYELEKYGKAKHCWPTVKRFLMLLWIACDQSVNFCQYILTSQLFLILQKDLQKLCFMKYTESELKTFTVKSILGILHNICRHVPNCKWKLRNEGIVSMVRMYLVSEVQMIRLKSFIILSYIISEAENEMINSDDDNFVFIFKVLADALESENHKSSKYGMGVVEVMKGLNNLAINDENKIRIVRNGGLPLFQTILETGGPEEIKVTITTLWSLAFHHYNKVKMREMPVIMKKLFEFQHCRDDEICHAARGTFWELENVSKSSIGSSISSSLSADKDPSQPHIMISYQWDSQAVMMKVKDRLRHAGYKVWMDIEHMTGSTLEAMALAVEKAAVVLICMSQKYKDSPNCRTEAEYVYRLRKDFVPLRLQKEYIPDGWLGILVGTRLYFDIYSEDHLDDQVPRLIRELRDRGKISPSTDQRSILPVVPQRMTSREAVPILHHPASPTVSNWTTLDVKRWLTSLGLMEFAESFEQIDGPLLLELQRIQETAPEYFHGILRKDFGLAVCQALRLSKYLRELS